MMVKNRWSIGSMMVVVSLLACDCGVLRAVWSESLEEWTIVVLPMLNFLTFGLWSLSRKRPNRNFWIAFEWIGWPLTMSLTFVSRSHLKIIAEPINWLVRNGWLPSHATLPNAILLEFIFMAVYTIPLLLAASIAGWFWDGYRLVIVRRPSLQEADLPDPQVAS